MIVFLLIVFGLIFGSFVNALVWRLHEHRDWVKERSECPNCHHTLAAKDLVPVFSWLSLGGKCRYCHRPIPDSPLVELSLPILFVVSYIYWPEPLSGAGLYSFIFWLIFLVGFVALAVYDLKWFLLPNVIVFPLIALAVVDVAGRALLFRGGWQDLLGSAVGAAIISGLFFLIYQFSRGRWIGFGDVKLAIVLGLLAGGSLPALLVLFIASLVGTVFSLPMVVAGRASRKSHLPFGPMLIIGVIVVVLFGQAIIDWYTSFVIAV
ncbi:MAG TPA: prepilin peptidase [Candidatus Pristimantibacillus sp.]|nr:prepilin peptidase [Candidatus Pristimantibacillus sp.]